MKSYETIRLKNPLVKKAFSFCSFPKIKITHFLIVDINSGKASALSAWSKDSYSFLKY
jgi:hypothetical protein